MRHLPGLPGAVALATILTSCGPGETTPGPPSSVSAWPPYALRGRLELDELTYRIEPDGDAERDELLRFAVEAAAKVWGTTDAPALRPAGEGEEAQLEYRFLHSTGAAHPFGTDSRVARSGPMGPNTFVELDGEREWQRGEMFGVVLHETGHVLGLGHVEDPLAVMHPGSGVVLESLGRSDIAALECLYRTPMPTGRDIAVVTSHGGRVELQSVLPEFAWVPIDFQLFDTDGDGDDELLLWRTEASAGGALVIVHFGPGARPIATHGPLYGAITPGAGVQLARGPRGEPLILIEHESGLREQRRIDKHGRIQTVESELSPVTLHVDPLVGQEPVYELDLPGHPGLCLRQVRAGDVDGDGRLDLVVVPVARDEP